MRLALLLPLLALACATSDAPADDTDETDPGPPTFTRVKNEVLDVSCALSTCHGAGMGSGSLRLGRTAAEDHAELVDVVSTGLPAETLVIPGNSADSYLFKKMNAVDGIDGDAMPPGFLLPADVRQLVADWIDAGALDD